MRHGSFCDSGCSLAAKNVVVSRLGVGLPLADARDYRARMFGQLDSLQKVFDSLLLPVEARLEGFVPLGSGRGSDPVWQLGHAAFDASYALLRPFAPDHRLLLRFGDAFDGRRVGDAWQSERPAYPNVRDWWKEILREGRRTLAEHGLGAPLPSPVVFTAYSVGTTSEACDYVLFHTSFHLGRAYELLRSPARA